MSKVTKDCVEFVFVGENMRGGFNSMEDALKYVKKKLPSNGKSWKIEEIHTKVIEHEIESERKVIDDKEITKRIIDYFIEHATANNIKFDVNEQYFFNPEHRSFRDHDQLYSFLCTQHYLGYTKEQYMNLYHEIYKKYADNSGYAYDGYVCECICYLAMAESFNMTKDDILAIDFSNYQISNKFAKDHPDMFKEKQYWFHDLYFADGDYFRPNEYPRIPEQPKIWKYLKGQELLDAYKEELKKVPIEDWYWERNVGDYKPCHNYKLVMKRPEKYNDGDFTIHMFGKYLPGIMFRDGDIYITNSQYIGRHVNLRKTSVCDVNEDLYKYCIKNLK